MEKQDPNFEEFWPFHLFGDMRSWLNNQNIQLPLALIHRGSYMSAHVLLNLLNELWKRDKMLLTFCLLLIPLWESVIVLCFVVRYFMSILVLQSS